MQFNSDYGGLSSHCGRLVPHDILCGRQNHCDILCGRQNYCDIPLSSCCSSFLHWAAVAVGVQEFHSYSSVKYMLQTYIFREFQEETYITEMPFHQPAISPVEIACIMEEADKLGMYTQRKGTVGVLSSQVQVTFFFFCMYCMIFFPLQNYHNVFEFVSVRPLLSK